MEEMTHLRGDDKGAKANDIACERHASSHVSHSVRLALPTQDLSIQQTQKRAKEIAKREDQ